MSAIASKARETPARQILSFLFFFSFGPFFIIISSFQKKSFPRMVFIQVSRMLIGASELFDFSYRFLFFRFFFSVRGFLYFLCVYWSSSPSYTLLPSINNSLNGVCMEKTSQNAILMSLSERHLGAMFFSLD